MGSVGELCRLCARSSETVIHVFSEEGLAKGIAEKIHTHLPIVMTPEDCLPTLVCSNCINALEVCHSLFQLCLDADVQLRKILNLPDDPDHMKAMMLLRESLGTTHQITASCEEKPLAKEESNLRYGEEEISEHFKGGSVTNKYIDTLEHVSTLVESEQERNSDSDSRNYLGDERMEESQLHTTQRCKTDADQESTDKCSDSIAELRSCNIRSRGPPSDTRSRFKRSTPICREESSVKGQDVICDVCGVMFRHQKNLKMHMKKHQKKISRQSTDTSRRGKRRVECRVCGERFESFWYMARHRSDAHSKEEVEAALKKQGLDREHFECDVCGKLLSCQSTLKQHKHTHSAIRNFHCEECGRGFYYKAQLKAHVLFHSGGPHTCPECPKHFRNAFALRVHLRTHTGEKPYPCEHCPKAFHSKANYEQHLQVHSSVRKFKCTFCPYRARRPDALRLHIRVHTNERPYVCKFCGRAFKQKSDCKKHENLHERKPGSAIKARKVKQVEVSPDAQVTNQDSMEPPQLAFVKQNEETDVAVRDVIKVLTEQDTAEATATTEVITALSTDSVPKIYEYQEGGVREIVISEISFEDSPNQSTCYWK